MFQFGEEAYGDLLIRVSPDTPLDEQPARQTQSARGFGPISKPWPGQENPRNIDMVSPAESNAGEHDAALALEDMAMSRGQNVERITRDGGIGGWSATGEANVCR